MNTFVSDVTGYSPYEIVFGRTPPDLTNFNIRPELEGISLPVHEYIDIMEKRKKVICQMIAEEKYRQQQLQVTQEQRKHPLYHPLEKGDLVMFNYQYGSELQAPSRKLVSPWIGPVKIQKVLDETHFILSDWEGKCLPVEVEVHRIKPYQLNIYSNGHMMSITNIYKHLNRIKLQQEQRIHQDHIAQQRQCTQSTQT
jgi:hypothetical protein